MENTSTEIIPKFKCMFRINLMAIVAFALGFLAVSYVLGITIMGVMFFVLLTAVAIINKRLLNTLKNVEQEESDFLQLKAFSNWIKKQMRINEQFGRFLYPITFLALVLGFYFKEKEGLLVGEQLVIKIVSNYPETTLLFGVPLVGIVIVFTIMALLVYYAPKIYQFDMKLVYSDLFTQHKKLLQEMEASEKNKT